MSDNTTTSTPLSTGVSHGVTNASARARPNTSTPAAQAAKARRRLKADQNGVLIAGGIMAGAGWILLYRLVNGSPPLAFYRWLFFILACIAVTGTVIPLVWFMNQRFSRLYPASGGVILRQGLWFGLYIATAAWLQMTRALTPPIAFFLGLAMVVIEVFLRLRERGQHHR
jgi:hypothetical protein